MLVAALAAALVIAAAPAYAAPRTPTIRVPPIAYTHRTLANGLEVYAARDASSANVEVQVWYRVGAKDDPAGRSGFAHLFEHMMFKATEDLAPDAVHRLTEDVGGYANASTWDDFTNYYETVPANHLQRLLWAEASRMSGLVVDQASFDSEREVVKEELRMRVLADPYGRLWRIYLPQASFQSHPYRRTSIGSIEDLDAATLDDVRAFHETYYRPDNAVLVVVGAFDPAQLDAWIDTYFGRIVRPRTPTPRVTMVEPPRTHPVELTGYAPNAPLPAVVVSWPAPASSSRDAAALDILDSVLSGGKSSRLYDHLVHERQLAGEIYSDADLRAQPGMFYVGATLAAGKSVDEGEAVLRAEVAAVRDRPVSAAELAEAKVDRIANAVRARETVEGRANLLGWAAVVDGDAAHVNRRIADLQAVSAADVQRVARRYLADERRAVVRYLPGPAPAASATAAASPAAPYAGPIHVLKLPAERASPPPAGPPPSETGPTIAERILDNGLRVIVANSSSTLPLVNASLVVRSGSDRDPISGVAALTAALVTEGTTTRTGAEIARGAEALGATLWAASDRESSTVALNAMPQVLPAALAILADVVRHPAFRTADVERVRRQKLEKLMVDYQSPGVLADAAAGPAAFAGGAFGHAVEGTPGTLARLSAADLAAEHARDWRPDNAFLVLTGDITADEGFALAERTLGDWRAPPTPMPAPPPAAGSAGPRTIAIDLPDAGQAAVALVIPSVGRGDRLYYPAIVANAVLGHGYAGRLSQEIRVRRGLAYDAGSVLTALGAGGMFAATTQTKNESAAEVAGLLRAELTRLAAEPPDQTELAARRAQLIGDYQWWADTVDGLAADLAELALHGVDLHEVARFQERTEAVTAADVRDFARERLQPGRASLVVVGDAGKFAQALRTADPGLVVVPAADLDLDSPTLRRASTAAAGAAP